MNQHEFDLQLAERMGSFFNDPLGFVMFAFPWGKPGTPLERHPDGPDKWTRDLFKQLAAHVTANLVRRDNGDHLDPFRAAVASGHGIGKSATVAWIILWLMSTRVNCRGIVTANTENQLLGKTWPELAKWHQMAINKHWFTWTASQFYFSQYNEDARKTYMFEAVTWSENRTEGFAGLHNENSAVVMIFDEASGLPRKISEVAAGAMTDGEPFWFKFGNPTVSSGDFYDCFHGPQRDQWWKLSVDSRSVRITNKRYLQELVDTHGEDSDFVRVRVRGLFPRAGDKAFIPTDLAEAATRRTPEKDDGAALVIGVDPARHGADRSVICFRRGRDAQTIPWLTYRGMSTEQLAFRVAECIDRWEPDMVVIDGVGVGGGVVDVLKNAGYRVTEVNGGGRADDPKRFYNKRAEIWDGMKDWLKTGAIPDDRDLVADLTGIEYKYTNSQQLQMEKKEDLKKRGLASPDLADALSLTFARNIARRDSRNARKRLGRKSQAKGVNYALFG